MKAYLKHHINSILWFIVLVGIASIIFLLFSLNLKTDQTVRQLQKDVATLQKKVDEGNTENAKLLQCLIAIFDNSDTATKTQVQQCIDESHISLSSTDTKPSNQGNTSRSNVGSSNGVPSSTNNTVNVQPPQSNNSQNPTTQPTPTDNDPILKRLTDPVLTTINNLF